MLKVGDEPIPGYQLERFLGKGQFGQVWACTTPGRARAALKFLDLSGKQGWKEFRGIQRVKAIRHPHLMPITALWLLDEHWHVLGDSGLAAAEAKATGQVTETLLPADVVEEVAEPRWLVVSQLLGDQTLGDLLKHYVDQGKPGIPVESLLRYMEEAAKGIDFLNSSVHDLGDGQVSVQHCDIKPANILLVGDSVLICDFGVAHVLAADASATATGMVGSPAYMAPECVQQRPSPASDQYSLAVTYVELRTGKLPFKSETYFDVIDAHRRGKLDLSRLPPAEQAVIRRATSVDPKDRFPTTQEMVRELRRVVEGRAPVTTSRGKQWAMLAVTATATLAAIVLFVMNVLRPNGNGDDGPDVTTPRTVIVQVDPFDALVQVDQQPVTPDAQGHVTVEFEPSGEVVVQVSKDPDYEPRELRLNANTTPDDSLQVKLEYRPEFLHSRSFQRWTDGDQAGAIGDYVAAVQRQPSYASFAPPQFLQAKDADRAMYRMAISPDGRWLVAGDAQGSVLVWDLQSPTDLFRAQTAPQLDDAIESLAVGNRWLATADLSGTVVVVPLANLSAPAGRLKLTENLIKLAISPDERWLLAGSDDGSGNYQLQRWALANGSPLESPVLLGRHAGMIDEIYVPPAGRSVFTGSWDRTVQEFAMEPSGNDPQGRLVGALTGDVYCVAPLGEGIAFAGDGSTVDTEVASDGDSEVRRHRIVYAPNATSMAREFPDGHEEQIEVLRSSETNHRIASGSVDGTIQLWEMIDDQPRGPVPLVGGHAAKINAMSFDASGQWLVSASDDGTVTLWDIQDPAVPSILGQHAGPVTQVVVSADGDYIYTSGDDGSVRRWELRRSQLIRRACQQLKITPKPAVDAQSTIET